MFQDVALPKLERNWIKMKDFIKNFVKSGLQAAGFGPLILVIFYSIYSFTIKFKTISVQDVNKNII